jgi:hypothetical protein
MKNTIYMALAAATVSALALTACKEKTAEAPAEQVQMPESAPSAEHEAAPVAEPVHAEPAAEPAPAEEPAPAAQ